MTKRYRARDWRVAQGEAATKLNGLHLVQRETATKLNDPRKPKQMSDVYASSPSSCLKKNRKGRRLLTVYHRDFITLDFHNQDICQVLITGAT